MTSKRKAPEVTRRPPPPAKLPESDSSDEEMVEESSGGTDDPKKTQTLQSSDTGSESEAEEAKGKGKAAVEIHPPASPANTRSRKSAKGELSSRKPLFQRLWAAQDEVDILQGMIDFFKKEGVDPTADMDKFYEFMKGKLSIDFAQDQLRTKIRISKCKFQNNEGKGKVWNVSKGKETEVYELGKVLWGSEDGLITSKNRSGRPPLPPNSGLSALLSRFAKAHGYDDAFLMRGMQRIAGRERDELEKKWEKLQVEKLLVISKEALLIHEVIERTLKEYKKAR